MDKNSSYKMTFDQFNVLLGRVQNKLKSNPATDGKYLSVTVNGLPLTYVTDKDTVYVDKLSADTLASKVSSFQQRLDTLKEQVSEVASTTPSKGVATPARNAAMKDLGGLAAKERPIAKVFPSMPGNQLLGLEKEQKAAMDAATKVAPQAMVQKAAMDAATKVAPQAMVQKATDVKPTQVISDEGKASTTLPKPKAAEPAPQTQVQQSQPQVSTGPVPTRRYRDPVQAALWQARTDALQRYYAEHNWGSLGADELGGVLGSYVNSSTHKKNGQELVYDAKKGEWVDVTPINLGDDAAWRKAAGKNYSDFNRRWEWAWQQANPEPVAPTRAPEVDDATWAAQQNAYEQARAKWQKDKEDALARQKANTALIAQSAKDERDLFGPGRSWFGGEPGSSSLSDMIGILGRPKVVSDKNLKNLISAIYRRF